MISKDLLWDDFAKPLREEWNNEFTKSLKGAVPSFIADSSLHLQPLYTREESGDNLGKPGMAPFTRGIRASGNDWITVEYIGRDEAINCNKMALAALQEGIGGIRFDCSNSHPEILPSLLKDIHLAYIQSEFVINGHYSEWIEVLSSLQGEPGINQGFGVFLQDSIDFNRFTSLAANFKSAQGKMALPRFARIDAAGIANRGAGIINRLAISIALGHELFIRMLQSGFSPDDAGALLHADIAIGPDFLTEVSGLRAFRRLWAEVVARYTPVHACSAGIHVHTETAIWNFSVADRYNNLLRATGSAMASVLGNCNSHAAMPYDLVSLPADSNSSHMARSIQFLLKDESFFHRVGDPAGGSYFIEQLTDMLCEAAWAGFLKLEEMGGISTEQGKALAEEWISHDAQFLKQEIQSGNRSWIGVNRFPPKNTESLEPREIEMKRIELEGDLKQKGK
jgi:methylmalonyl-CoA mutase